MYIRDILIAKADIDFRPGDTLEDMESKVSDLRNELSYKHFSKAFVARQEPVFYLVAESKANDIIKHDLFNNKLVPELENQLTTNRALFILTYLNAK